MLILRRIAVDLDVNPYEFSKIAKTPEEALAIEQAWQAGELGATELMERLSRIDADS